MSFDADYFGLVGLGDKQQTINFGSNKRKAEQKANKQHKRNCDRDDHIVLSSKGIPRRLNGNKLGLAKREKLFLESESPNDNERAS